jgi:hypothetical protein
MLFRFILCCTQLQHNPPCACNIEQRYVGTTAHCEYENKETFHVAPPPSLQFFLRVYHAISVPFLSVILLSAFFHCAHFSVNAVQATQFTTISFVYNGAKGRYMRSPSCEVIAVQTSDRRSSVMRGPSVAIYVAGIRKASAATVLPDACVSNCV